MKIDFCPGDDLQTVYRTDRTYHYKFLHFNEQLLRQTTFFSANEVFFSLSEYQKQLLDFSEHHLDNIAFWRHALIRVATVLPRTNT